MSKSSLESTGIPISSENGVAFLKLEVKIDTVSNLGFKYYFKMDTDLSTIGYECYAGFDILI